MGYRIEKDFLGSVKVPSEAYYGVETQRSLSNYKISGMTIGPSFIKHYAIIKRCAALANMKIGKLDPKIANAIVKTCDEIIKGRLADQFTIDVFQSGAGTSINMNMNEVIANRALEIMGH
ncbi:MAG: lyase family protein, partial [Candidatus Micrarchaeales archaeon]